MARQKKIKPLQHELNLGVPMKESATLESLETEIDAKRVELEKIKIEIEEKKSIVEKVPAREVSEDEKYLSEKQVAMTSDKSAAKAKIEKMKAHDSQMVTGKFMNRRVPGQPAKLLYQKYDTDVPKWWNLEDGKVYTIPRGFADQINEHYYTPKFVQRNEPMDPTRPESQIQDVDTSNKKYAFVATNY